MELNKEAELQAFTPEAMVLPNTPVILWEHSLLLEYQADILLCKH